VIAVDTNILVYAHRKDSEWHAAALAAVESLATGANPWAIPWPCAHEFFSIVTHPRIFAPPSTRSAACGQLEAWMESPSVTLLGEDGGYWSELRATLDAGKIVGPAVHDARIAALCARHGVAELWTADRDFSRFAGLTVRNPLTMPGAK
jgi:toxin-antitoxin system PIN domain toxin